MSAIKKDNIVECEIELLRIFFPKNVPSVETDEYAIFSARVVQSLQNCNLSIIKLKGNVPQLESRVRYKVMCRLCDQHEVFGDTYEILFMNRVVDFSSIESQKTFLKSIINSDLVDNLYEQYSNVVDLLEHKDVKALSEVKGIGEYTAKRIITAYENSKDYSVLYTKLNNLSLTKAMIQRLITHYKSPDTIVEVIENNPYKLTDVDGIGFKKADTIALKMGMNLHDTKRIKGFIDFCLKEQGESGKSYLFVSELLQKMTEAIGEIPCDKTKQAIKELADDNKIVKIDNKIALTYFYELEKSITKELYRLNNGIESEKDSECVTSNYIPKQFDLSDWEDTIRDVEEEQGFKFTEEQLSAIRLSTNNNVLCLTGLAGSGKSSTANGICALYERRKGTIAACALSGKAALRITETTGIKAQTIHKTLGYLEGKFSYNKYCKMSIDVLVVDESTMINGNLFLSLLQAVPTGAKVIIMGDVQQLTPIGNCQVFADMLNSESLPVVRLTKPHRQAMKSGIIPMSIKVAKQQPIFNQTYQGKCVVGELKDMQLNIYNRGEDISDKIISLFKDEMQKCNNILEVQVCIAKRAKGNLSCYTINNAIQKIYNLNSHNTNNNKIDVVIGKTEDKVYKYTLYVGDKVINTKNNYNCKDISLQKTSVFNGNIGIIKRIEKKVAIVDFVGIGEIIVEGDGLKNLELAYACTTHKLQGSQFDSVIVGIDNSSYIMNNSEWLYTALTRAKKYCILCGENNAIQKAIKTKEVKSKQTFLCDMLRQMENKSVFINKL